MADSWIGGTTAVIQIGDLVNNAEESDRAVLSYAQGVHERAKEAGGSFRAVWGDHDLENLPKLLPKPFVPPEWFSLMLVRFNIWNTLDCAIGIVQNGWTTY